MGAECISHISPASSLGRIESFWCGEFTPVQPNAGLVVVEPNESEDDDEDEQEKKTRISSQDGVFYERERRNALSSSGALIMKELEITTRTQWRRWLARHHDRESEVWLVFYKRHTGRPTLDYDALVEEALCFGWIDSIIKRLDDDRYARKVTPRKPGSRWSEANKRRVAKLLKEGRMTEFGLARIKEAKKSGVWSQTDRPQVPPGVPRELTAALNKSKRAKAFFSQLAPSYQKQFIGWIATAKRPETKERRVKESIALLEQGQKLGMK